MSKTQQYPEGTTLAKIEAAVASEHYFTALQGVEASEKALRFYEPDPLGVLTLCVLVFGNGATVTGESSPNASDEFNAEKGRAVARHKAFTKALMKRNVRELLGVE